MNLRGAWEDPPALNDCWGRSIWGLGTAVSQSDDHLVRHLATKGLERAMRQRSPWPRAMAFAALGAAEVLSVDPDECLRVSFFRCGRCSDRTRPRRGWPWPEQRLTYANATLAEAMIAAGSALDRPVLLRTDWTSWSGCSPARPNTDTSRSPPSEVEAPMTKARDSTNSPLRWRPLPTPAPAHGCRQEPRWVDGIVAAAKWFLGANDSGVVMWDPTTGGAFDGLQRDGANLNQGTESTLALLSTLQHARSLVGVLQ